EPRREANAVVMAMMDTSGSMGTFEKYVARSFFFWMVRFLRTRYRHVRIVFLAHDTRAREVTEEQFFTKGESDGTRCSSVYEMAMDIIGRRFAPSDYNLYPFHFSDGDNFPSDNQRSQEMMRQLAPARAMATRRWPRAGATTAACFFRCCGRLRISVAAPRCGATSRTCIPHSAAFTTARGMGQ